MASHSRRGLLIAFIALTLVAVADVFFGVWFAAVHFFAADQVASRTWAGIAIGIMLGVLGLVGKPESPRFLNAVIAVLSLVLIVIGVLFLREVEPAWVGRVLMTAGAALLTVLVAEWAWRSRRGRVAKIVLVVVLVVLTRAVPWLLLQPPIKPVHLVVHTWRSDDGFDIFRYGSLVKEYEREHPGTTIELREDLGQEAHHTNIMRALAAGRGLADVVAVELRTMGEVYVQPSNWVDLKSHLPEMSKAYAPYRFEGGLSPDGATLLGLPMDMPSVAMCYRRDLLQQAGLPVDRDAVAARWRTWPDFVQVGREYRQRTGKGFIDTVQKVLEAVAVQRGGSLFVDRANHFVPGSASLQEAWRQSLEMLDAGLSANAPLWTQEWLTGMGNDRFAVMICPGWMLGLIEQQGGAGLRGQWDVAALPGGGGNWGGTWLAVPAQSAHPRQAAELAAFLTGERGGLATATTGEQDMGRGLILPAHLGALEHPRLQNLNHGYFHDAPIGRIFSAHAKTTKAVYLGPRYGLMLEILTSAVMQIQQSGSTAGASAAWQQAMRQAAVVCGC